MLTEAECIAQGRCFEHQALSRDLCPWHKNKRRARKERKDIVKHICSDHTTSKESKGWISFVCSCGIRWGRPA